jgi:hypothetical protein
MNPEFPVTMIPLLILSGIMQWRAAKYFGGSDYTREQLMSKYSSGVCFICAFLFIIMNFFF